MSGPDNICSAYPERWLGERKRLEALRVQPLKEQER